MYDFRPNLEPGNADGHTVLRYLVEAKQMPLEAAIERVYQAVTKFAQEYRSDQNKLMTGMVVSGVLGLPVFFPFGVPSLLIAGAIAGSVFRWQELGTMRDRLKPEYSVLKGSVLLEQFIKWLAAELRSRREQAVSSGQFQSDALIPANIIAAYEHTVFAVTNGEHLENNASDPILALFVLKLRQHTNNLPAWVIDAFRQLEQAEVQRANDVEKASRYMWGNLEERYPEKFNQIGQNTRLGAVDVPSTTIAGEGEQRLGKTQKEISLEPLDSFPRLAPVAVDIALEVAKIPKSTIFAASPRVGKGIIVAKSLEHLQRLHPDLEVWLIDPKGEPTEAHYWSTIPPVRRCHYDLRDWGVNIEEAVEVFGSLLYRFNQSTTPKKLLILDEFVTLAQKCSGQFIKDLKDFIVGICSSGEVNPDLGEGRFIWVVTQSPYVTDLGFRTKASTASFRRVFVVKREFLSTLPLAINADFIPPVTTEEVSHLLDVSGRAFFWSTNNTWHPVPEYQLAEPYQPAQPIQSKPEIQPGIQSDRVSETPEEKAVSELTPVDNLAEPLKSIWLFAKRRNDWVTAKEIYKNELTALKNRGVKQIRQFLGLLADTGYGEIDEMVGDKPKSDSSVGFRAY